MFFDDGDYVSVVRATWAPTLTLPTEAKKLFKYPLAFRIAFGQWASSWDVMPDGQRFLVTNPSLDLPATSMVIVTNWDQQAMTPSSR